MLITGRSRSVVYLILIYFVVIVVTVSTGYFLHIGNVLLKTALLDFLATVLIFIFSVMLNNSSTYDPYWSVAPLVIVTYWVSLGTENGVVPLRSAVILVLIFFWGIRLTFNFFKRWNGFIHEDWRYADMRKENVSAYWPVSFAGIHLLPTVIVFLACIPVYFSVISVTKPLNFLDAVALLTALSAILIELFADKQLRAHLQNNKDRSKTLKTGLWRLSRHPNYFGEVLFWWGMYFFVLAGNPAYWWTIFGPVVMTLLFVFVSIPLMDKHMTERKEDYDEYKKRTSAFIPWFSGK